MSQHLSISNNLNVSFLYNTKLNAEVVLNAQMNDFNEFTFAKDKVVDAVLIEYIHKDKTFIWPPSKKITAQKNIYMYPQTMHW